MRKSYPKVPKPFHDSVPDAVFAADDLTVLEKVDGSNTRLCLYDERYAHLYGENTATVDPADGDILIGSKGNVRGTLSDSAGSFDGNFQRLLTHLRDRLDRDALRACHDAYDSPLLLFGEHMVKHTLDYGYDENPPPAFLGFDVFRLADYAEPPANPFDERFDGFLALDDAWDVFDRVGLETIHVIDRDAAPVDPDDITVPVSAYGPVQAEGVIFRSDQRSRRVKHVTAQFQERMHEAWGMREDEAETGAELFAARYLTNPRLRKQVHKLVQRQGADAVDPATVAEAAVADAWEEDLTDIRDIDIAVCPTDIYPLAHDRAREVIDTMRTNADLNDTTLDQLWAEFSEPADPTLTTFDVDDSTLSAVEAAMETADDPHDGLVRERLAEPRIHETAERLAAAANREVDRWVIEDTHAALVDNVWYESLGVIANLSVAIVPSAVDEAVLRYVTEALEARDDVDTSEKPEDWQPSVDDAETSGLGDLF